MLSVSSSSYSTPIFGWPVEDAMYSYNNNHGFYNLTNEPTAAAAAYIDHPGNFTPGIDQIKFKNGDARKINHNASERHRRKKINELYSSLRSLLPASEQSRKLSIPTTIARVLKYIPELEGEVERLERKKHEMSKKIYKIQESTFSLTSSKLTRADRHDQKLVFKEAKANLTEVNSKTPSLLTSKFGEKDVVIQISTSRALVSEILSSLEENGFHLFSVSSSESIGGRVFLNLHLQKQDGIESMDYEGLNKKLLSILEKQGDKVF